MRAHLLKSVCVLIISQKCVHCPLHSFRVTAEVKHNPTNTIVCKAHGEWNGTLEFTYNNGETKVIDTTTLPVYPKKIRPLEKQGPMEPRWGPSLAVLSTWPKGQRGRLRGRGQNHVLIPLETWVILWLSLRNRPVVTFSLLFCSPGVEREDSPPGLYCLSYENLSALLVCYLITKLSTERC